MSKKTYLELQQQIKTLQEEAERLRAEEASDVLSRIKEAIAVYGFTAEDLGFGSRPTAAKRGGSTGERKKSRASRPDKAQIKYRDDMGNTWGGRGPRPAWLKAALEAGRSLEDLAA